MPQDSSGDDGEEAGFVGESDSEGIAENNDVEDDEAPFQQLRRRLLGELRSNLRK